MSTASALEREMECAASAVLSPICHESGEPAERGNAIHTFVRSCIAGTPRAIALAAVRGQVRQGFARAPEQWEETCEQIDFSILTAGLVDVRAEVAYRISRDADGEDRVRELGINLGRKYPPREDGDIDGTNDFEGREPIAKLWVVTDLKTGFWPVTDCERNPQMRWHAYALMLKHGVDRVKARIAYVAVDGQISWDVHVFTRLEMDLFADELDSRKKRIARANEALKAGQGLVVHAGDWCRYCHAIDVCPRYTALAHAMLGELREVHAKWGVMTDEERAAVTLRAFEARDLAERICETQKARAKQTPIDLGNGKVLKDTGSGVRIVNAPRQPRSRRVA